MRKFVYPLVAVLAAGCPQKDEPKPGAYVQSGVMEVDLSQGGRYRIELDKYGNLTRVVSSDTLKTRCFYPEGLGKDVCTGWLEEIPMNRQIANGAIDSTNANTLLSYGIAKAVYDAQNKKQPNPGK